MSELYPYFRTTRQKIKLKPVNDPKQLKIHLFK